MTRNITLAIDDADLDAARRYAAEHSTTVNALVRSYIAGLNGTERRRQEAVARMIERSKNGPRATYAPPFNRASLWDRGSAE